MNLDHEYGKIKKELDNGTISEERYAYECYKIQATSNKYNIGWSCPSRLPIIINQNIVNEDYKEATSLYESGLLKQSYYLRDMKKLLSACEDARLTFPGPSELQNSISINRISLLTENDGYEDLDDEDEYEDLDGEDEYEGDMGTIVYEIHGGGVTMQYVTVGSDDSEYRFTINGNEIQDEYQQSRALKMLLDSDEFKKFIRNSINWLDGVKTVYTIGSPYNWNLPNHMQPDYLRNGLNELQNLLSDEAASLYSVNLDLLYDMISGSFIETYLFPDYDDILAQVGQYSDESTAG